MQDISTTLRGRIGSEPMMKHVKGDVCVTTFRLAITRWRFVSDVRTGNASYVEDGAYWYTVETWDTLASNVFRSCRKGDPVVVVARPVPNGWIDGNGQIRSSIVYRASSVGHDLARGTSQFTKNGAHLTEEPAGGTQGDPYSTRQGPGSAEAPLGVGNQGEVASDVHADVVTPHEGTDILPTDVDTQNEEPTLHAPTGAVGVEVSPLVAPEEHVGSEDASSDPGQGTRSCFEYCAVDHGLADATKNVAFEPIDGDADEPPDAA